MSWPLKDGGVGMLVRLVGLWQSVLGPRLDGEGGRLWRALGSRFELMDNKELSYVLDLKPFLGLQKH